MNLAQERPRGKARLLGRFTYPGELQGGRPDQSLQAADGGSPVSLRIFSEREAEVFCVFERDSLEFFGLRVCKARNHNTFRLYKR